MVTITITIINEYTCVSISSSSWRNPNIARASKELQNDEFRKEDGEFMWILCQRLSEIMQAGKAGDGQHLAALWQFINLSRGYFTVLPLTSSYQQSFTVTPQQGRYNSPPVGSNPVSNLGQFCWKDAGSQRINLLFFGAKKVSSTCSSPMKRIDHYQRHLGFPVR